MISFIQKQIDEHDDVLFLQVYTTSCPETTTSYKTLTVPEFVFKINEKEVGRLKIIDTLYNTLSQYVALYKTRYVNLVHEVDDDTDLSNKLKGAQDKLVVIDIGSISSLNRGRMLRIEEKLAKENLDVVFLRVDMDKCGGAKTKYQITDPLVTVVFVRNEAQVKKIEGPIDNETFTEYLNDCK